MRWSPTRLEQSTSAGRKDQRNMAKNRGITRIVLTDYKGKKKDEGALDIELPDGKVLRIDPPALWPDELQAMANDEDSVGLATALVGGEKEYASFLAAGGSANLLMAMIADTHGIALGESSASSSS